MPRSEGAALAQSERMRSKTTDEQQACIAIAHVANEETNLRGEVRHRATILLPS